MRARGKAAGTALVMLASLAIYASCRENMVAPAVVSSIEIHVPVTFATQSSEFQLTVTLRDTAGVALVGPPVQWSSSDLAVFTISGTGLFTAIDTGTAFAIASLGGVVDSVEIAVVRDPVIEMSRTSVGFASTEGGATPPTEFVVITNSGGGTLTDLAVGAVTYEPGQPTGWLSAALTRVTGGPDSLQLRASIEGLGQGTYDGQIEIAAAVAANSPQVLRVSLFLDQRVDANLPPVFVNFTVSGGGGNPPPQTVTVAHDPADPPALLPITYAVGQPTGWLNASISGLQVTLDVVTGSLPPGTYLATLPVANTTQTQIIFVAFTVNAASVSITPQSPTAQAATVNQTVASPPSIRIADQNNNPVLGVPVTFDVIAGGGRVNGNTSVTLSTDGDGRATLTSWLLGTGAGTNNNSVRATATDPFGILVGNPVTFVATANPGPANSLVKTAGDNQTVIFGNGAAIIQARLNDQFGNPIQGVTVEFDVLTGGGSLSQSSASTNASGIATLVAGNWVPGAPGLDGDPNVVTQPALGRFANTLRARIVSPALSQTFSADVIMAFVTHIQPLLTSTCNTSGCHGNNMPPSQPNRWTRESLVLETDGGVAINRVNSLANCGEIVDQSPLGSANNSLLMTKLDGPGGPAVLNTSLCGTEMPQAASQLSFTLRNTVRAWINNGAPNN